MDRQPGAQTGTCPVPRKRGLQIRTRREINPPEPRHRKRITVNVAAGHRSGLWLSSSGENINFWFAAPNSSLPATRFSSTLEVKWDSRGSELLGSAVTESKEMWGGAGPEHSRPHSSHDKLRHGRGCRGPRSGWARAPELREGRWRQMAPGLAGQSRHPGNAAHSLAQFCPRQPFC